LINASKLQDDDDELKRMNKDIFLNQVLFITFESSEEELEHKELIKLDDSNSLSVKILHSSQQTFDEINLSSEKMISDDEVLQLRSEFA